MNKINRIKLIITVLLSLLLVTIVGCENPTKENDFVESSLTFEELSQNIGEMYLKSMLYNATSKKEFNLKEDYYFKNYVDDKFNSYKLLLGEDLVDNSIIEYEALDTKYQLTNTIVNVIPADLFSLIIDEGIIYFGKEFGFYIKTTPQVNPKTSIYDNYINFTPEKYYESIVTIFMHNVESKYNNQSKQIQLNDSFTILGPYVFHTTTESTSIEYFPNSSIKYSPTTILYEDLTGKDDCKLKFNVEYKIKNNNGIIETHSIVYDKLSSGYITTIMDYNKSLEKEFIEYTINVEIHDSYGRSISTLCSKKELLILE